MQTLDDVAAEWAPPGPGPWQQDSAHNPVSQTIVVQEHYTPGFNRGFAETFQRYGLLLDSLALGLVNGFPYHQPRPFDLPGPDGPLTPAQIGAEIGRRAELAAAAFETRLWRQDLDEWDSVRKPSSVNRHRQLGDVDLTALSDEALGQHLRSCAGNLTEAAYQHHRHNMAAMLPVGDFLLQAGSMLRRPPAALLALLDGYSPVSGLVPPEMAPALDAIRRDEAAQALLTGEADAADRVRQLRARVPEVDEFVRSVGMRLVEGFDVVNPTLLEQPAMILGRLAAALDHEPDRARARSDELAASLRAELAEGDQPRFDELLAEARLVYRLRDERGLYNDIPAIGLLRLALLEVGRRLRQQGVVHEAQDALDASVDEAIGLLIGATSPTADDLAHRAAARRARIAAGAPRFLGTPPPAPPPLDQLPPPLARVMGATGLLIEGILGQLEDPMGADGTISGIAASGGVSEGTARLVNGSDDLERLEPGEVLIAPTTGEAINSVLHLLAAIVTDHGSFASHAGIVGREMGIPAVVGTVNATRRIPDGARVRVDGTAGVVTLL